MAAASLVATVSGDPTYSDPPAISVWNLLIVGGHPRSADDALSISASTASVT